MLFVAFCLMLLVFSFYFCHFDYSVTGEFFFRLILYGTPHLLNLDDSLLFQVGEVSATVFKYFLRPFLFLFSSWVPSNVNTSWLDIAPQVSVLISFHSFFSAQWWWFPLLCSGSLICSSESLSLLLIPSSIFFISVTAFFLCFAVLYIF